MLRTIETDPISPFGAAEEPHAEWTYRDWLKAASERGVTFLNAYVAMAGNRCGRTFRQIPPFPTGASLERTVGAYVNHGRWLWDCPICNASQVCAADDPRAFCIECFNGGDGWWPVDYPDDLDAIRTLLERRTRDDQKSWTPTETVEQLQAENLSLGIDPDLTSHPWPGAKKALRLAREHLALAAGSERQQIERGS